MSIKGDLNRRDLSLKTVRLGEDSDRLLQAELILYACNSPSDNGFRKIPAK